MQAKDAVRPSGRPRVQKHGVAFEEAQDIEAATYAALPAADGGQLRRRKALGVVRDEGVDQLGVAIERIAQLDLGVQGRPHEVLAGIDPRQDPQPTVGIQQERDAEPEVELDLLRRQPHAFAS